MVRADDGAGHMRHGEADKGNGAGGGRSSTGQQHGDEAGETAVELDLLPQRPRHVLTHGETIEDAATEQRQHDADAKERVADDKSLQGLDLTGIEIVGEAWGEIDAEKVAALRPDLIVAEFWPLEKAWSGLADDGLRGQISKIAPIKSAFAAARG